VRWDEETRLDDALGRVSAKADELGPGRWVGVLGGWHPHQFEENRAPTVSDLDRAAPDNPAFAQRAYAEAYVNSRGMAEMGWSEQEAPGGLVSSQSDMAALRAKISEDDVAAAVGGTRSLLRELNGLGLVGAIDASGFGITKASYDAFLRLFADGETAFRPRLLLGASQPGAELADIEEWVSAIDLGSGDEFVRYLGAGEVIDYGAHDMEGLTPKDIEDRLPALTEISMLLASNDWPVHAHSILDTSITTMLDAWKTIDRESLRRLRWAICHADQIGDENLRRVADLGLGITIQNGMSMRGVDCAPTWGLSNVTSAPPVRSMLDLGIPVAAGSDGTVACAYNPWRGVAWLITGDSVDGTPPRVEGQRLTRDEALRLYTSAGAWFSFEEATRGNFRPGSHADLAVLSEDPLRIGSERISEIESVLTVVAGRPVHSTL
jgi:predicted amidohydrolase YtcJ